MKFPGRFETSRMCDERYYMYTDPNINYPQKVK